MPKDKHYRKILENRLKLVKSHGELHKNILESVLTTADLLGNCQFNEAAGYIFRIYQFGDLLENQIKAPALRDIPL